MNDDLASIEARADSLIDNHAVLLRDLVALRKKHDLTQAEVADRMGVSQPTVAGFERYDANPTLSTIRRYALAVGARITETVTDDCCPQSPDTATLVAMLDESTLIATTPAAPLPRVLWEHPEPAQRVLVFR